VHPKRVRAVLLYAAGDMLATLLAWCAFFLFRKIAVEGISWHLLADIWTDTRFRSALIVLPVYWGIFYFLFNFYTDLYRKSRLTELSRTLVLNLLGCIILFFALLLDDQIRDYTDYYLLFGMLYLFHTGAILLSRMSMLTIAKMQLKNGKRSYNTIIVGGTSKATDVYKAIHKKQDGFHRFIGFVTVNDQKENGLSSYLPRQGTYQELPEIIVKEDIEEVVIAIDSSEHNLLYKIVNQFLGYKVRIRILPDAYDFITGNIHTGNVTGEALIEIEDHPLLPWQRVLKRIFDIVASLFVLIFFSPFLLWIAWRVKRSSPGPILFFQKRTGQYGEPFTMVKFRSMYEGAEEAGPQLSRTEDPRITPWGRTMRKYRLDELPQFINVLLGNMSIVGPRPERPHFIEQIVQTAPEYKLLLRIAPGITSWGMVQYGYASSVKEMLTRMRYDLLYLHNQSFTLDIKILLFTILIILKGKGK
jgi:exopolysaccharide biosynthesis polyprenyl glycosylphosphotransferase